MMTAAGFFQAKRKCKLVVIKGNFDKKIVRQSVNPPLIYLPMRSSFFIISTLDRQIFFLEITHE